MDQGSCSNERTLRDYLGGDSVFLFMGISDAFLKLEERETPRVWGSWLQHLLVGPVIDESLSVTTLVISAGNRLGDLLAFNFQKWGVLLR